MDKWYIDPGLQEPVSQEHGTCALEVHWYTGEVPGTWHKWTPSSVSSGPDGSGLRRGRGRGTELDRGRV